MKKKNDCDISSQEKGSYRAKEGESFRDVAEMLEGRGDGSYEHSVEGVPCRDTLVMVRKQRGWKF